MIEEKVVIEQKLLCKLYVIIDPASSPSYSPLELAEMAVQGGADFIQLRDKKNKTRIFLETASRISEICKNVKIPFIVNDRTDIALLSDAAGVHLGNEDLPIKEARKILGGKKIIGGTANSLEKALELEKQGADYIGFGHIFPTQSKIKNTPPVGVEKLKKMVKLLHTPIIAIGGIDQSNLEQVLTAAPYGIAVIHAVCGSENPEKAARDLKEKLWL